MYCQARGSASCLIALEKFDRQLAIQYSLELLGHKSGLIRRNAIRILAYQTTAETLEAIRERSRRGDFRIKVASLATFKKIGGWSILPDLIDSLLDENADVRQFGCRCWRNCELSLLDCLSRLIIKIFIELGSRFPILLRGFYPRAPQRLRCCAFCICPL